MVSASPRRQWPANWSSHAFHSGEPFSATTVSRGGPSRLGRPGFLRCGSAIGSTTPVREGHAPSPADWVTRPTSNPKQSKDKDKHQIINITNFFIFLAIDSRYFP